MDDVSSWLDDLGLADYQQNFMDNKINGKMLFEIEKSDLETLVGIFNPLEHSLMKGIGNARWHLQSPSSKNVHALIGATPQAYYTVGLQL